jgi:hypothetical protein
MNMYIFQTFVYTLSHNLSHYPQKLSSSSSSGSFMWHGKKLGPSQETQL